MTFNFESLADASAEVPPPLTDAGAHTLEGESKPCRRALLVGQPNVGKSVVFGAITRTYVTVSNYPGTTVEGEAARIDRLASIGILPGVELRVQQTRPVVVVESDETVLALEREISANVLVIACSDDLRKVAE